MSDPLQFLDERFKIDQGPIQTLKIGPKKFHLVFDPKLAQEVLVAKSSVFIQNKNIFDRIKPITGDKGLVQLNGAESRETRRMVRPMFSPNALDEMNKLILRNSIEEFSAINASSSIEISAVMAKLVLRNAFGLFLGIELSEETSDIASEFQELNKLCGKRMVSLAPIPLFIPTPANQRIKSLRKSLRSKIQRELNDRIPQSLNIHKIFKDSDDLVDQCMTFIFAGHETTASSLAFTFLLLGSNQDYIRKISSGDDELALNVYKESLRLYPPAYMLAREVSEDSILGGITIRKGENILIGVKQLQRHPRFHEMPESFVPERFQKDVNAFLPFGLGPKSCIAEKLAYQEAVTIIKYFCQKFYFKSFDTEIKTAALVTLHPKPGQKLYVEEIQNG